MLDSLITLALWAVLAFVVGAGFAAYRLKGKDTTMQALIRVMGGGGSGIPK